MVGTSFEECFREHYPALVAYGTSLTGDRDTARDLDYSTRALVFTDAEAAEITPPGLDAYRFAAE